MVNVRQHVNKAKRAAGVIKRSEMKILGEIKNKSMNDRTNKEEIGMRCGLEGKNLWTKTRKFEHIQRKSETRTVRKARNWSPNGRRPLGRLRKR